MKRPAIIDELTNTADIPKVAQRAGVGGLLMITARDERTLTNLVKAVRKMLPAFTLRNSGAEERIALQYRSSAVGLWPVSRGHWQYFKIHARRVR